MQQATYYGQSNGIQQPQMQHQPGYMPQQGQRPPRNSINSQFNAEERCKNKIFIGGLDPTTTKENLEEYFGQYGTIIDAVVMTDPTTQRSRGFGFVTYDSGEPLDSVQNSRPHIILNKTVDTRRAMPRDQVQQKEEKDPQNNKKVFIGGITKDTTDDQVKEYCSTYGTVEALFVQRKGERHYGFCTFEDFDSADKMILHKDHHLNGSNLQVKKAVSKAKLNSSNPQMANGAAQFGAPYQPMGMPNQMAYPGYPQSAPQMQPNAWRPGNMAYNPQANQVAARPNQNAYAYATAGFQNPYIQQQQQTPQSSSAVSGQNAYGSRTGAQTTNPTMANQMTGYQYPLNQSYNSSK